MVTLVTILTGLKTTDQITGKSPGPLPRHYYAGRVLGEFGGGGGGRGRLNELGRQKLETQVSW